MAAMPSCYRFGDFELDCDERTLRRGSEDVPMQELPFRLLAILVERSPALVKREDLREQLWPPGTHLEVDASLNTAVARVREALGDDATAPRFVATVPRRGYRFVAEVSPGDAKSPLRGRILVVAGLAALAVASGLGVRWVQAPRSSTPHAERPAEGRDAAREHLVIGRHLAEQRSREGLEKAIASFQSAAAIDPTLPEAYSGLASSYTLLGIYDFWRPRDAFAPAETMAKRALELDPESAEAHLAMGLVAAIAHWDWEAAEREAERARSLAPESAEVWSWRGGLLSALGRHDEAIASGEEAVRLDPVSPVTNVALAWRFFQAGRVDEAIAQSHRAIELAPDYYDAWDDLKWIQLTVGHEKEALRAWIRSEELDNGKGEEIERIYAERGLEGLHRASIEAQLGRYRSGRYQSPYDIALEYSALREADEAISWLQESLAERETDLVSLAVDPRMASLRGDPRFQTILEQISGPRK